MARLSRSSHRVPVLLVAIICLLAVCLSPPPASAYNDPLPSRQWVRNIIDGDPDLPSDLVGGAPSARGLSAAEGVAYVLNAVKLATGNLF